jgi:hypothetical protein
MNRRGFIGSLVAVVAARFAPKPTVERAVTIKNIGSTPLTLVTGPTQSWSLNWGDGSPLDSGIGEPPETMIHTFNVPGDYMIRMDADGRRGVVNAVVIRTEQPTYHLDTKRLT